MAKVTLTFDNGPEPEVTNFVLDVLAEHQVLTSFFVIGNKLDALGARDSLKRAREAGHWIGNHSYTHTLSLGDTDDPGAFDREVTRTKEALGDLATPGNLFRPYCNAGIIDHRVFRKAHIAKLEAGGYTVVLFDSAVWDWEDAEAWIDRAVGEIAKRPWTTLVLHDIVGFPPGVVTNGMRNLDRFLRLLASEGHEVVQEIEPSSMPMVEGKLQKSMDHLVWEAR